MLKFFKNNLLICLSILMAIFSLIVPQIFVWLNQNIAIDLSGIPFFAANFPTLGFVNILLCIIMFGMGLTLRASDFQLILKRPVDILIGVVTQYVAMSLLGWLVAWCLTKSGIGGPEIAAQVAVGLVLLGCVPGGTASNVMTFLARGDVAMSITITMCTTLLAPVLTPALTLLLAGAWIDVNFWNMFISIIVVVLLPIILGIIIRSIVGDKLDNYQNVLVMVSTICIVIVIGCCVGPNSAMFTQNGISIVIATVVAVTVHHLLGLASGYAVARFFHMDEAKVRTMTLEIGLQNSGLSVTLANSSFAGTMAVLACVVATVVHQIIGPIVAGTFAKKPLPEKK